MSDVVFRERWLGKSEDKGGRARQEICSSENSKISKHSSNGGSEIVFAVMVRNIYSNLLQVENARVLRCCLFIENKKVEE